MPANAAKVNSGDPLRIPAPTWNSMLDMLAWWRSAAIGGTAGAPTVPGTKQTGMIRVRNVSGADWDRFSVVGLESPVWTQKQNDLAFKNQVVMDGDVPDIQKHRGRFAITTEPIKAGSIGWAIADGVTPVQVESLTGKEEFADIKDGDSSCLQAGGGPARILWLPPESDDVHYSPGSPTKVWGIVQLGPNGGGVRYAVLVTVPTGDPVSNTWGNMATGNPCPDATGANADIETEIELYCTSPLVSDRVPGPGGSHLIFTLAVGQVVAYLPLSDGKGIIVSPDYDWNNLVEARPHELLSEKHSDTDAEAIPAAGDMIVYCDDLWTTLPVGNLDQVLQVRNNLPTWQNLPNADHVLLDGDVHTDTAQNVIPFPGDMIIRDGQNQWNVLIAGGDTQSLRIDPATHVPAWMDTWPAGGAIGDFLAWHKDENDNYAPLWSPPVHGLLAQKYHDDVAPAPTDYTPEKGALIAGVTQGNVKFWVKEPPAAANDLVLTSDNTQDSGIKWAAPASPIPVPPADGKTYALTAVNNSGTVTYAWIETTDCP